MSTAAPSELDALLPSQDHRQLSRCCKLSYKPRRLSSKGAVLVLVWWFLVLSAFFIIDNDKGKMSNDIIRLNVSLETAGYILLLVAAIISGWLADTQLGRSRVLQTGLFVFWLGVVAMTVGSILLWSVHSTSNVVKNTLIDMQYVAYYASLIGMAIFFSNVIQFGLEQMPDASSDTITLYISWLVILCFVGDACDKILEALLSLCTNCSYSHTHSYLFQNMTSCALLSIAMCSKFLFSHWLIDHRQNRNPLKTVYHVLKFAKQHKYPVNRSAFTYCEDEIPSRIDLGKSKYGGPFTTEEVEDVKTFFRMFLILTIIWLFSGLMYLLAVAPLPSNKEHYFLFNISFSLNGIFIAVAVLIYKYVVHPLGLFKNPWKLNMLKKIGLFMLYGVCLAVLLLTSTLLTHFGIDYVANILTETHHSIEIIINWLNHILAFLFWCSSLQFACSQAPEHMKGFFVPWTWLIVYLTFFALLNRRVIKCAEKTRCDIIITSAVPPLSLLVFIVYCCVARWYKRRERDEPCNQRAIIEEIYDRRVQHNSLEESNTPDN